ncbi:hypothetical protein JCM10449v2_006019 [Rhodotorula kratochvilovae]
MSLPLPHYFPRVPVQHADGATPAPLSGSNRLPVSPRRSSARLLPLAPHPAPSASSPTTMTTFQRPFPVPAYLRHATLFFDRFETVPSAADGDLALEDRAASSSNKGKGRAPLSAALGVELAAPAAAVTAMGAARSGKARENPPILLPTCWDESDRCALLELTSDGLGVSFAGSAKYGDRDAAAVRANRPVPPQAGVYYYEVEVLDKGVSGYIGIGLSDRNVPLGRLPGWEDKSYGFHADDGRAFCSQGNGEEFGPTFSTGDVVGCGIDWTDAGPPRGEKERAPRLPGRGRADKDAQGEKGGGRVFFTKNSEFIGYAFCGLQGKLYPTVGLRTPNEAVRVNFGAEPFRFDIEGLVLERKRTILSRLASTDPSPSSFLPSPSPPIPSLLPASATERTHETLQALISSYLVHHGYAASAASFAAQVRAERVERSQGLFPGASASGAPPSAAAGGEDDLLASLAASSALRAQIRSAALTGRADEALSLLEAHYPTALHDDAAVDASGGIHFRLRCRVFIEAALALSRAGRDPAGADAAAPSPGAGAAGGLDALLALGQALHAGYGADARPAVREELQAVLGLMAYADPEREATGRTRTLLDERERALVADEVNAAVLRASNLPPMPALEALYRHAAATVQLAGDVGVGSAAMVDVRREVLGGLL